MRFAMIADTDVIDIAEAKEAPIFPPTNDGIEIVAVEIAEGVQVSVGMQYVDGVFVGEYKAPIDETPIDLEEAYASLLLDQQQILINQAFHDEVLGLILLGQQEGENV